MNRHLYKLWRRPKAMQPEEFKFVAEFAINAACSDREKIIGNLLVCLEDDAEEGIELDVSCVHPLSPLSAYVAFMTTDGDFILEYFSRYTEEGYSGNSQGSPGSVGFNEQYYNGMYPIFSKYVIPNVFIQAQLFAHYLSFYKGQKIEDISIFWRFNILCSSSRELGGLTQLMSL